MQRIRLLGPAVAILLGGTLALTACNSSSVSGSQQKASGSTNAEAPKSTTNPPKASGSQGLVGAAHSQTR